MDATQRSAVRENVFNRFWTKLPARTADMNLICCQLGYAQGALQQSCAVKFQVGLIGSHARTLPPGENESGSSQFSSQFPVLSSQSHFSRRLSPLLNHSKSILTSGGQETKPKPRVGHRQSSDIILDRIQAYYHQDDLA